MCSAGSEPDWYANARAAYRASSLDVLIYRMSPSQQRRFQRAIVEMALWFLEPRSAQWDSDYRERTLEVARAFLAASTPETIHAAVTAARRIHIDVDGQGAPDELLHVLDDISSNLATAISGDWSLRCAAAHIRRDCVAAGPWQGAHGDAFGSVLKRRQVEAAHAILRDEEASLARPVEPAVIEEALADVGRMYREAHLRPLVHAMSETQRARFKHAVVGQGVTTAQASLSPHNRDEWALLEAARRWLEQPDQERLHAAEASAKAARRSYHQPETYAHAIAVARAAGETDACAAAWAIKTLYPDHSFQDWTSPPEDWEPPPLGAQWQIEAAWQILHDRDPPDLIISTDTPART